MLYFLYGFYIFLLGLLGVGKSFFVEFMYKFVISFLYFGKNVLFIIFNCVDYLENL